MVQDLSSIRVICSAAFSRSSPSCRTSPQRLHMTRTYIAVTCTLLATAALQCQTSVKSASRAVGVGKPEAVSNEDVNTRAYIELLRTDLKSSKAEILGEVLLLDTDQATKFWPIYKEYEAEYAVLGDQVVALVKSYSDHYDNLTDAVAEQLGNQVLSIEEQRNALKKKYYARMTGALGGITATRFLQVENQLERIMDLQISAQLPVIGEK